MAKQYFNMSSSAYGENESQNFAVLLLENAKLPASTFNNIVTQLITKSTNRGAALKQFTVLVPMYKFNELLTQCPETSHALSEWNSSNTSTRKVQTRQTHQLLTQAMKVIEMTEKTAEFAGKTWTDGNQQEGLSLSFILHELSQHLR